MHEVSLGRAIQDYLTGETIQETTYEEFRQALARLLVEEKGYPRDRLKSKVGVTIPIEGKDYCRNADLVAYDEGGRPLLVVIFCAGDVESYVRESVAMARLIEAGPAPLALVTDMKEVMLVESVRGELQGTGMLAIPGWERLLELSSGIEAKPLPEERLSRERRILYTYSEFLSGCCSGCPVPGTTGNPGFKKK